MMSPAAALIDEVTPEGAELQPKFHNYVLWSSTHRRMGDEEARSIAREIIAARFRDGRSKRARQKLS